MVNVLRFNIYFETHRRYLKKCADCIFRNKIRHYVSFYRFLGENTANMAIHRPSATLRQLGRPARG